jgi:hypothetical protein
LESVFSVIFFKTAKFFELFASSQLVYVLSAIIFKYGQTL